ncbi:uncharacterized protein si:ch211-151h10.2 isoform X2 [Triplophysa rosa]|uniref:uncharacterized protein si:ch211-151h10.2 isoform X2 n=1 Tax=Triplophysa rosa TaxID=992332 RepID=UPI002545C1AE|nr:uncharacterized protein si:ch211-151h10.2 isoform X2 [Triplophysa rosa]
MPQLSSGDVWSCLERSWTQGRGKQDGKAEEREMLDEMNVRETVKEKTDRVQRWMIMHWQNWAKWTRCLFPIAVVLLVFLEESPLHPSVCLTEAGARLLLAALLCAVIYLCFLAFQFLRSYKVELKQVLQHKGDVIEKKVEGNQHTSITAQQDAGHLVTKVNVLADGLVVCLLHEPLPDASESHIRDLLIRLEVLSRTLQKASSNDEEQECPLKDRVNHINSYLQDRVRALRSLLQVQRESESSVCEVQTGLQKHWALLENLHTRVTLRPDSKQEVNDLHAVLTDTENLFTEIGQFKSKVQQCRMQLETSIQLLQGLRSSQQGLSETVSTTVDSAWTKHLLQSNTDLFSEIHEDFASLEQQTSNFVIHLRGLNASEEKTGLAQPQASHRLSLPAVPVYTAASDPEQTHSDPETDSECTQKPHSKLSPFHLLCGVKRRRSSPLV